ncbi:hypothetical protein O9993_07175 [Vibrio lentus]|nr:hypothetical protein [Vibrio lentus]
MTGLFLNFSAAMASWWRVVSNVLSIASNSAFALERCRCSFVRQGASLASSISKLVLLTHQHAAHAALGIESYHDANACLSHQVADSAGSGSRVPLRWHFKVRVDGARLTYRYDESHSANEHAGMFRFGGLLSRLTNSAAADGVGY